jgi:hypothetical protein
MLPVGKIDPRSCAPSKNQTQTVGMVIKNQNALYFFACGVCCPQSSRLLDNENLPRAGTGLSVRKRKAGQIRTTMGDWPNKSCGEGHRPAARAFPFHELTLGRRSHGRHGASVGFYGPTREALTTTSFGRAPFAKWLLSRPRAEVAPRSAAELKPP